jgi:hypothetical protein
VEVRKCGSVEEDEKISPGEPGLRMRGGKILGVLPKVGSIQKSVSQKYK